jgi:tripartite ATP-independent transporter DctM subunit
MEWYLVLVLIFAALLVLFATGLPIFVCFLVINLGAIVWIIGTSGVGLFINSMTETVTSESLVAIPMFVLLGELLFRTGGVMKLFEGLDALIGAVRGRLYIIAVAVAAFLGAISGSVLASVAVLGRFVYPIMIQRGCDRRLAIGTVLSGATLDAVIPPSVIGIILATLANISIGDFLVAGIGPGIFLAVCFAGYAVVRTIINPALDSGNPVAVATPENDVTATFIKQNEPNIRHLLVVLPLLGIVFLVLGLVLLGIAQPTEAAACGIVGALLFALMNRTFSWSLIGHTLRGTALTTSAVMIIIASSKLFSQVLAFTGAAGGLVAFAAGMDIGPWASYVIMMLVVFVLCMFLDQIALMLIIVPIYQPLVQILGFDPIWFWMMFLVNILFGGITPPLGYTIFVFRSAAPEVPLEEIYKAVTPIIIVAILAVVAMSIFPSIVTFLPSLR